MDTFFVLLLCFSLGAAKIKITNLDVPSAIQSGSVDEIILDCDFEAEGESGIEVKWFLNGLIEQIYQWIPETNKSGQAIGRLKDNIDVNYKASDDRNTMYRALRMTNISPDLSGNYSCKVSGDNTEDVVTKSMIIYDPADYDLELSIDEENSTIFCNTSGVFPAPDMRIFLSKDNESDVVYQVDQEDLELDEFNDITTYSVSVTLDYSSTNISGDFFYGCELVIPGTNYSLYEIRSHYLDDGRIETQIEEEYVNSLNATDSTEDPQEFETQIEEDFSETSVESSTVGSVGEDDSKESEASASFRHLPSVSLFTALLLISSTITPWSL